jgi:cytochrome c oxidase assembly factor CtaG
MSELSAAVPPVAVGVESPWWSVASILVMCTVGALYGIGLQELWLRRGRRDVVTLGRALAFAAGLAAWAVATTGPVHAMAEKSLTGHMTQHMMLLVVAGPLLGAGAAGLPVSLALPSIIRLRLNRIRAASLIRWIRAPAKLALFGGLMFSALLWLWHLPAPYLAAERHPALHAVEHLCFLGMSWLVSSAVLSPGRHRLSGPVAFLLLFAIGMTGASLGAVLTFSPVPLYPPEVYGADALTDQQLAGLIMWIPMDVLVLAVAVGIFARWLSDLESRNPADASPIRPTPAREGVS